MSKELQAREAKGALARRVLPVVNTVSLVIGICAGIMHLREISDHAEAISSFLKISSIGYLEHFTDENESVQANLSAFLPVIVAREGEIRSRIEQGEPGHLI